MVAATRRGPSATDVLRPAPARDADALFARALDLGLAARPRQAEPLLRRALHLLSGGTSPAGLTRARVLLSLASVRSELGHVQEGLALLEEVEAMAGPPALRLDLATQVAVQRGYVLLRTGRVEEAITSFGVAAARPPKDPRSACALWGNRGAALMMTGRAAQARPDLRRCLVMAQRHGLTALATTARFNLAFCDFTDGDLAGALSALDRLSERDDLATPGLAGDVLHTRALCLYAAGLLAEANEEFDRAATAYAEQGSPQDKAENELRRSLVLLTMGRAEAARDAARGARQVFARRGMPGWALLAELTRWQAELACGAPAGRVAVRLTDLSQRLAAAGLREDARVARLEAATAFLRSGRPAQARSVGASALTGVARDRIAVRLRAAALRAELATASGDPAGAQRHRRAGLDQLHRHLATFGSLDLQTAASVHGRQLAAGGLARAVASGRPEAVLAWAERARSLASRVPAVRPPADEMTAELLQQLRHLRSRQRAVELGGGELDPRDRRRRADLERQVRERTWRLPGSGLVEQPVSMSGLREALGSGRMVAHLAVRSDAGAAALWVLVVDANRARLVPLGSVEPVLELLRRVRADLDALAVRGYPPGLQTAVQASLTGSLEQLDVALLRRLHLPEDGAALVLAPAGALVSVPWTSLPSTRGRPVTVARSVTVWAGARRRPPDEGARVVALACGPDLAQAGAELDGVAAAWSPAAGAGDGTRPGSRTELRRNPGPSTGHELRRHADGADLLHVAAHGAHESASPMFSSLQMSDGPVFGYDLAALARPPRDVVLSACDLGRPGVRPGDELLGMTAALLHAGTRSVVAAVARVGDDVAARVMVEHHRALRSGMTPAAALAIACTGQPQAPFVCFGTGW